MPHPARKRAFLLYMAGDNDLSDAGLRDVDEICREGASPDIHVGLEIDTRGIHTGSIRYEITEPDFEGNSYRTVIERRSERDSGQPRTLKEFLGWGLERYPADERVLVVGGHGNGFRTVRRAIALDEFGSSLDMNELSYVLDQSGVGPDNRLAILGFDACLMCMLEIAHHFAPYARVLVGSQQTEPGDGWPYDRVLRLLKDPERELEVAAAGITEAYAADYKARAITNVTQSAIRLDKTEAAMAALSDLGDQLAGGLPAIRRDVVQARNRVQTFYEPDYVDAIDLARKLQQLEGPPPVAAAAAAFETAVRECVIRSRRAGEDVQQANGLSLWFPEGLFTYTTKRSQYRRLNGVDKQFPGWLGFLDEFFERG